MEDVVSILNMTAWFQIMIQHGTISWKQGSDACTTPAMSGFLQSSYRTFRSMILLVSVPPFRGSNLPTWAALPGG